MSWYTMEAAKPTPTWQFKKKLHTSAPAECKAKEDYACQHHPKPSEKLLRPGQPWEHSEIMHHSTNQRNYAPRNSIERSFTAISTPRTVLP